MRPQHITNSVPCPCRVCGKVTLRRPSILAAGPRRGIFCSRACRSLEHGTPEERFWSRVEKTATCWNWTGGLNRDGYGQTRWEGASRRAHRIAYLLIRGQDPGSLHLHHTCENPRCVNPEHLEPLPSAEHVADYTPHCLGYQNKRKTHCKHGHEFNLENTRIRVRKNGQVRRECRQCDRIAHAKERAQERRAALKP